MVTDAFLWIDGIPGDSPIKDFEDWIEVVSFDHSIRQTGIFGSSSGGIASAERSDHQPLTITKKIDTVTPKLAEACCRGTHFREIKLSINSKKINSNNVTISNERSHDAILVIQLKDVMICSVSLYCNSVTEGQLVEAVSFVYGQIEWLSYIRKEDGSLNRSVRAGWDITRNREI
jgi:type VI secretion system Hcp family effector